MKFLVATGNAFKVAMFRKLLAGTPYEPIFLCDLENPVPAPEETEKTVQGNALLKAKYYSIATGLPALADDAALEFPALKGEPGVMARRWGGELPDNVSDEEWLEHFLKKAQRVPAPAFRGKVPFSRCLYFPDGREFYQNDHISFAVVKQPRRPFKPGSPLSAVKIMEDGRHELDVPENDKVWDDELKKEGLYDLLSHLDKKR